MAGWRGDMPARTPARRFVDALTRQARAFLAEPRMPNMAYGFVPLFALEVVMARNTRPQSSS